MRSPRSLITLLFLLAYLLLVAGRTINDSHDAQDLFTPSRTYDQLHHRAGLSNAERFARGLPLPEVESKQKHRSGGTRRYTAHIVKRSASATDPETFNIALQKTSTDNTKEVKRGESGAGWAAVVEGQLTYTDSVELAAKFVWAAFLEGEMRALRWIPDDSQGVYQEGVEYAMYALQNSGIWSTGFGDVPADAATKFFDQVLDSVFSPTLPFESDTTATAKSNIWIIDTSGNIHFAPDVSTAIAMYPGCSVAVAQTIVPGNPAIVDAALGYQSSALTSAGQLYVLGSDGVGKWIGVGDGDVFSLTDATSATMFYFPSLGTASPQKVLYQLDDQTSTVILADETQSSAHLAGMQGSTTPALFTIPTNGKGIVTTSVQSASWNFYSDSTSSNDLTLCSTSTSCGADFKAICVELVPNGQTPGACADAIPKVTGSEKWLYATYVIGAKKGWIGLNTKKKTLQWIVEGSVEGEDIDGSSSTPPATFIIPSPADAATQAFSIKLDTGIEDVRVQHDSRGYPVSFALASFTTTDSYSAQFIDVLATAHISVTPEGFIKTPGGEWFRTFDWQYPLVVCEPGNTYCSYGYEPICIEAVDVGGTPSKCLGQMQSNVAKNGRKIYAVTEDSSLNGWLTVGDELFKPLATRDTASTFYIPGLGNGSVAQQIYTEANGGGYNGWWGTYFRQNGGNYDLYGWGQFGLNPGSHGSETNVAFNVSSNGLGLLTPDPNFYYKTYAGMSWYYNPDDTLFYLATSDSKAKSIGAKLVRACLEMVDANGTEEPSACGAAIPPPQVKRQMWAEFTDGSGGGWVGYDAQVGVGGLKWSLPDSPTATRTFYAPTDAAADLFASLKVDIGAAGTETIETLTLSTDPSNHLQFAPTTDATATINIFHIPTNAIGVVTLAAGTSFFTAPWYEPIYSCPLSGCGSGGPFQPLCVELVEVGGTPGACMAQAKAKIEKNPTVLYAATADGKVGAYARANADGVLVLDGSADTASTFFVPGLNNGTTGQDTYAAYGSGYGKLWASGSYDNGYWVQGFSNLRTGYLPSAGFEMPIDYPSTSQFGIVQPDPAFYKYQFASLSYFVKYDDLTIHSFPSEDAAIAKLGNNIAALCLESVTVGGTPGACAASFPKQSGPSYLYATGGDGSTDAGYISVNANTGKLTWTRTTSTANAATFYASQLGSVQPQQLLVKVGDTNRPLYIPSGLNPQIAGSDDVTVHPASYFGIPTSGSGIISSTTLFYTNPAGWPVWGCRDSKCSTSATQPRICIEIVPVGSAPGACLAQGSQILKRNSIQLYARSSDGSIAGYLKGTGTGMTPLASAGDATTFYVPTYGNGSAQHDTYAATSSGNLQKIWTALYNAPAAGKIVSTTKLVVGRSATSGSSMIPLIYGSESFLGAVTPYHAFFATQGALNFYINTDDQMVYAAPSDGNAAYIGQTVLKLCVEAVPVGGMPNVCVGARRRGPARLD